MRKDKLRRLERGTRAGREREEMAEVFLNTMAQIKVLGTGEEEPPPHPRANDPRYLGTVCGGNHRIAGVPDLSEESGSGDPPSPAGSFAGGVPDLSEE